MEHCFMAFPGPGYFLRLLFPGDARGRMIVGKGRGTYAKLSS